MQMKDYMGQIEEMNPNKSMYDGKLFKIIEADTYASQIHYGNRQA